MEDIAVREGIEILKNLSPKNQAYFMTMLRLAEVAEAGIRGESESNKNKKKRRKVSEDFP